MAKNVFPGVRFAGPQDDAALLAHCILNDKENGFFKVNWDKVKATIALGTGHQGGVIGVIDGPKGIEASAAFIFAQWWSTDDWHLEEIWTFVHPEHRKSTHAKKLYEFGKWLSDEMDKMPVLFGVLTTNRMAPKVRLAQRQLPQVGALFMHNMVVGDSYNQREFAEETQ